MTPVQICSDCGLIRRGGGAPHNECCGRGAFEVNYQPDEPAWG